MYTLHFVFSLCPREKERRNKPNQNKTKTKQKVNKRAVCLVLWMGGIAKWYKTKDSRKIQQKIQKNNKETLSHHTTTKWFL